MQLKDYQQTALSNIRRYLEHLAEMKKKADQVTDPDLAFDFAQTAWKKAGLPPPYSPRKNGLGQCLPTFCLKVPTGGGKTLLAVKSIDLVNMIYRKRRTGLVLWIVPTTQIYRQTIQSLKDKDHPYRQHLDLATGGRTLIREKTERFTPQDVEQNLVVMMLMLPSANRLTKETLKLFKDSGGFQDFFPPEDDAKAQAELLRRFPNLDTFDSESGFWGRQAKTSLGNTLRMLSPLIILDEGHKAYSKQAQATLFGFNPTMIVELSATPTESNILVDIAGRDLLKEDMIKLDLHLTNKASSDWRDTLLAAHGKRLLLDDKAREYEATTGIYIRPICLIQVERTGAEQRGSRFIHSEEVREHLIKVIGVPAEQIAVKTSEKDELKEVDDVGGLMSRQCVIRYIITKQALQEGWDCAFAYVLAILTNPSSKNAVTQLVGRILRQPFARKTGIPELDESYVFSFQQKASNLLKDVRDGFSREGLGDLRGRIFDEDESAGGPGELFPQTASLRDAFRPAATNIILPVFVVRNGRSWRSVNYDMDIAAAIPWNEVDLSPLWNLTLSTYEEKDIEHIATLSQDQHEVLTQKSVKQLREGGIRLDAVFMTRQISDIVPNPWQAHEFSTSVLSHFRKKNPDQLVLNNFVFLIEELKKRLEYEKERLAEQVFTTKLESDNIRFLVIGDKVGFTFPQTMTVVVPRRLTREDGQPLERSLFDIVPEDEFNNTERLVAYYLEKQAPMFFWYRNRSRTDYSIQGWRQHRIYPDFIFATKDAPDGREYDRVFVLETKGLHLKDNEKTNYVRKLFDICTRQATSRHFNELNLQMKGKPMRFEVLAEDEWERKLNDMIQNHTD